jgi:multimeric flavodoxin WrbA
MKKVLVITGSPRKGDSYRLTRMIEERVKERGAVNFKYIFLKDLNLEHCRGCLTCMKKSEEFCPIKDDALKLRDELLGADGVIFVSPVYVHQITALLKNFFDRFAYYMHRPSFHDRCALIVSTTELSGLNETIKYLEFPVRCWGFNLIGTIGVIVDPFMEEGRYRAGMLKEIETVAGKFHEALHSRERPRPSLHDVQFFNKIKTKILLHREKLPYDFTFWKEKGWLEANYFYKTSLNPLFRILGPLPVRIIKLVMRIRFGREIYMKLMGQREVQEG